MSKRSITLKRDGLFGFLSNHTVGTDALNVLSLIEGITDPEIVSESENQVKISYEWTGKATFYGADDLFAKYGLKRTD